MEPEPNRNMDELLKACAKQRKAQAGDPFELHPATRNLLQIEVSRLARRKSTLPSAPKSGVWGGFWLRLVFGGAICAVLVLIAGVSIRTLSRSPVNYQIAQDSSRQAPDFAFIAPAPSASGDSLAVPTAPLQEGPRASGRYGLVDSNLEVEEGKSPTPTGAAGGPRADVTQQRAGGQPSELLLRQRSEALEVVPDRAREAYTSRLSLASKDASKSGQEAEAFSTPLVLGVEPNNSVVRQNFGVNGINLSPQDHAANERFFSLGEPASPPQNAPLASKSVRPGQAAPTSLARDQREQGLASGLAVPAQNAVPDRKAVNASGGIPPTVAIAQPAKETQEVLARSQQRIGPVSYQNSIGQRFVQTTARSKTKVSAKPAVADFVLNSFVVEQDGARLRFIDEDGSIYEGAWLEVNAGALRTADGAVAADKLADTKKQKAAVSRSLKSPKAAALQTAENAPGIQAEAPGYQNSSFRVTGTNLSVNQKVVISGNFISNTNVTALNNTVAAAQPLSGGLQNFQNNAIMLQGPNSRIYGNAIVGGRTQIEINATAVAP